MAGANEVKQMAENPSESRHPYSPIPKSQFHLLHQIPISLYLKVGKEFIEFVNRGDPNRSHLIASLQDQQISTLYVHLADRKQFFRETEKFLHEIIHDTQISFEDKAQALNNAALSVIEDIYEDPDNTERIHATKPVVEGQITLLQDHPKAFLYMSNLGAHDYYSYTHSIGVASYALAYCIAHEIYKGEDLTLAGQAALLHDIGKAKIPWDIINKNGQLSDAEWKKMKQHPEIGHAIMLNSGMTSPVLLQPIRNHHENLDGSGYPDGLTANELLDITQIVGLADVFSALTTNRSYSNARTSFEAFQFMTKQVKNKFKPELFKSFLVLFRA